MCIRDSNNPRLHTDEALIALSICGTTDTNARKAFDALASLKGSELHSTVMLSAVDLNVFRKLGPVSYTHLDVYKRQLLPCACRRRQERLATL